MKVFSITFFLFCITNLLFAQNNSFNGTFFNKEISLSLSLNSTAGNYTGQFKLQEQSFTVTAQQQTEHSIIGSYPYFGNQVAIPLTFLPAQLEAQGSNSVALTAANLNGNLTKSNKTENHSIASNNSGKKAGGKSFGDLYSGYQFNIPSDWVGQQVEGGSYLIGHNTKPGFILVMPNQYTSVTQMWQESIQGIQEAGIQLMPTGGIEKSNPR